MATKAAHSVGVAEEDRFVIDSQPPSAGWPGPLERLIVESGNQTTSENSSRDPGASRCSKLFTKLRGLAETIRSNGMPAPTFFLPNVSSGEKPGIHALPVHALEHFKSTSKIYFRNYYKRRRALLESNPIEE
jgi:hypothetical protein